MKKDIALRMIFWISLAGVLFSGYLSYSEIFRDICFLGTCGTTIFTIPSCVYGLVMYLAVLVVSWIGMKD